MDVVSKFWFLLCPVDSSLVPDGYLAYYELWHLSMSTVMNLTASNEIFPHKCYLPLSPVTLPLSNEQHLTIWGRGDIFVLAIFPSAHSRGFRRKSSHALAWILIFPSVVSAPCSLRPSGHCFIFFLYFFFRERHPCRREQMFTKVSCEQECHTPTMISVSWRARQHSWCSVIEGWNDFLITDWSFMPLFLVFWLNVKTVWKKQGKMGGKCEDCQHAAVM